MRRALLALALMCVLLAGCAGDEEPPLRGSLSSICDLSVTSVRARLLSTSLSIEYLRSDGLAVIRVSASIVDAGVEGPGTIDLLEHGEISGQCPVPDLVSGQLILDAFERVDGSPIRGSLEAALAGGAGDLSLIGEFDTTLSDVR